MNDKKGLLTLIPAGIGLLLAAGVMTVFSACRIKDDGTWMHCHEVQNTVALCGAALAVLFAAAFFIKNRTAKIFFSTAAVIVSCLAFLLPGNIMPMCMMNTMRCYAVMQPFVRIMAAGTAICGIWGIIRAVKNK